MPSEDQTNTILVCIYGGIAFLLPSYVVLLWRTFPSRQLAIVVMGVCVLVIRTGASFFVSEFDVTGTPPNLVIMHPNLTRICLDAVALAARVVIVIGLIGLLRQSSQRPKAGSASIT